MNVSPRRLCPSVYAFPEVKCSSLPELIDGKMSPRSCGVVKSSFGQTCTMSCRKGYKLAGPYSRQCTELGEWTDNDKDNKCIGEYPTISLKILA